MILMWRAHHKAAGLHESARIDSRPRRVVW